MIGSHFARPRRAMLTSNGGIHVIDKVLLPAQ